MVVDRIERHDVLNAVMLAAVLLLLGFGILTAVRGLAGTLDGGLVESTKDTLSSDSTDVEGGPADPPADAAATETSSAPGVRSPAEVTVRVGNGGGESGVAAVGTELLQEAGYQTLPPKNSTVPLENTVVYHADNYGRDAEKIADILGVDHAYVEIMPPDPGVPIDGAHIVVIIGTNNAI